jgi:hypothetical protein
METARLTSQAKPQKQAFTDGRARYWVEGPGTFRVAEALVERALKLLGESAPQAEGPKTISGEPSLIACGARDVDGGNPTQLTTEGANAAPSWSPHGKNLAFGSDRTGRFEIWVMDADGRNRKQLWDVPLGPTVTTRCGLPAGVTFSIRPIAPASLELGLGMRMAAMSANYSLGSMDKGPICSNRFPAGQATNKKKENDGATKTCLCCNNDSGSDPSLFLSSPCCC